MGNCGMSQSEAESIIEFWLWVGDMGKVALDEMLSESRGNSQV